jgi:hypothetical protein
MEEQHCKSMVQDNTILLITCLLVVVAEAEVAGSPLAFPCMALVQEAEVQEAEMAGGLDAAILMAEQSLQLVALEPLHGASMAPTAQRLPRWRMRARQLTMAPVQEAEW